MGININGNGNLSKSEHWVHRHMLGAPTRSNFRWSEDQGAYYASWYTIYGAYWWFYRYDDNPTIQMFGLNGNAIALPDSHLQNRGPRPHSWYDPNAEVNRILTPYWGRDNNRDSISETAYVFDLTDTDGDAKILDHMSTHYITPNTSYRNRTLSLDRDYWILFD